MNTAFNGGAIYSYAIVQVTNSLFQQNSAGNRGGPLFLQVSKQAQPANTQAFMKPNTRTREILALVCLHRTALRWLEGLRAAEPFISIMTEGTASTKSAAAHLTGTTMRWPSEARMEPMASTLQRPSLIASLLATLPRVRKPHSGGSSPKARVI